MFQLFAGGTTFWLVTRQVHGRIVIGHNLPDLHILRQVNDDGAGTTGHREVKSLFHNPGNVLSFGYQVVVLGDGTADFDNRRFLKRVCANKRCAHLPGDSNDRDGIHLRIGQAGDKVGCPRAACGHAKAHFAGGSGVALGRKATALLVAGENSSDAVFVFGEGLVQRHAGSARVGEHMVDPVVDQALHENISTGLESAGLRQIAGIRLDSHC